MRIFFANRNEYESCAEKILFTGMIDEYYDYRFGELEYRSLRFETETLNVNNYQGNAVINYTEYDVPYTRIIEHKHFEPETSKDIPITVITREYPDKWHKGKEPYYPVNSDRNEKFYRKYLELSEKDEKIIFGGRLGLYKYMDMHTVIEKALEYSRKYVGGKHND